MNIHEYQAKALFQEFGVATLGGKAAFSPEEAKAAAEELGGSVWVVKAQIHAGGRGKAGGVKLARSPEEVASITGNLLGKTLVTPQTGPAGKLVQKVFVEQGCRIARELYLGMVLDRATSRITVMASTEGGVEIEEVAARTPEKIVREAIDPLVGLADYQGRNIAFALGLKDKEVARAVQFMKGLYRLMIAKDASVVEINPLVLTEDGNVIALDGKVNFDDNGLFRHPEIEKLRDLSEEDPKETEAKRYDLSYISLEGNIGCMVNGAGLAMATMDIIKLAGGEPANFLDVGGGATAEKVTAAFKIIVRDPNVKVILVNIFGGIMRCDVIAEGIIAAIREVGLTMPLVVRLEGTNVELGKKMLEEARLNIVSAEDLGDAARKAVACLNGRGE